MNLPNPQKSSLSLVEISDAQLNQRLDNFLLRKLKDVPRTRIYRIIRKGEVRVNKKRCKPDYKLQIGDLVRIPPIRLPQKGLDPVLPEKLLAQIEQSIVFENDHILIIDKPAGLAVHSGSGVAFGAIDVMRKIRPGLSIELAHRLDRDTSGCLLLAKSRQALLAMQQCLQDHSLRKSYSAIVKGCWSQQTTEIRHPLKKINLANGERRMIVDAEGKPALSRVQLVQGGEIFSFIRVEIVTGRTHQIRVHCQAEGHEIAGDNKYGDAEFNRNMCQRGSKRLMLHASRLELPESNFTPEIVINSTLPKAFESLLNDS